MGAKAEVTMTFAVTFKVPTGMSIPAARDFIRDALVKAKDLELNDGKAVKIHLTNKETSYGKR